MLSVVPLYRKCTRALTFENVCYPLQSLKDGADKRKADAPAQGSKIPDFKGTNSQKSSKVCHRACSVFGQTRAVTF